MIRLPTCTPSMTAQFAGAKPFPHIVIDNFIQNVDVLEASNTELREYFPWYLFYDREASQVQVNKLGISDPNVLEMNGATTTANVLRSFAEDPMVEFLRKLTGLPDLESDRKFTGGGVHRIGEGGYLNIHADFNKNPETGKRRRINALLYLNKHWMPGMNGELELWNAAMTKCEVKIPPLFNRLAVFLIDDDANHGHRAPWNSSIPRLSFALYYFVPLSPEEQAKLAFHWAIWKTPQVAE